jgi:hypothetical protein
MVEKSSHARKCNTEDVVNRALESVNQESNHGIGSKGTKGMNIDMDNCQVGQALDRADKLHTMKLTRPPHPPESTDLSSCELWFFEPANIALQHQSFPGANSLLEALTNLFRGVTFEELQSVFHNWKRRLESVIGNNGEHFTE